MSANELNEPNMFAPIATVAAFTQGEEWRRHMLSYIEGNVLYVEQFLKENIPELQAMGRLVNAFPMVNNHIKTYNLSYE